MAQVARTEINIAKNIKPKFERRIITAIRDNTPVSPDFYIEPIIVKTDKPVKVGGNMWYAKQVLEANGKISIEDAAKKLIEVHPLKTDNFEQAKKIFLHANKYGLPTTITKENGIKYVELA